MLHSQIEWINTSLCWLIEISVWIFIFRRKALIWPRQGCRLIHMVTWWWHALKQFLINRLVNGRNFLQFNMQWVGGQMLDYCCLIISLLISQNIPPIVAEQDSALLLVGKFWRVRALKLPRSRWAGLCSSLNQIILFISVYSENMFMKRFNTVP